MNVVQHEERETFSVMTLADTDGANTDFVIHAINPDNARSAEKIISLFKQHYGNAYPFEQVYDPSFWAPIDATEAEQDQRLSLTSIVADDDRQFLAHLAICYRESGKRVELLFPSILPHYRNNLLTLAGCFWKRIEEQAARQKWTLLYCYNFISQAEAQVLSARCFNSHEFAIIPHHIPTGGSFFKSLGAPTRRRSLLLTGNVFYDSREIPLALYPPFRHRSIIETLYRPLHLNRIFTEQDSYQSNGSDRHPAAASNSESTPLQKPQKHETFRIQDIKIFASTINNISNVISELDKLDHLSSSSNIKLCVKVALDDPGCPAFAERLEQAKFRFCGIMPEENGHDFVIYCRFDDHELQDLNLLTPRGQLLQHYMLRC